MAITIGLLIETVNNKYSDQILQGALQAAVDNDTNLIRFSLERLQFSSLDIEQQIKTVYHLIRKSRLDGLVFLGWWRHLNSPERREAFKQQFPGLPLLCMGMGLPGFHSVYMEGGPYIAEMTRLHVPDDCFIGGLLHDMGKVVLAQYFQDLFKTVWIAVQEENLSFYDAEKRDNCIDHARIGGYMAKKWQLPVGLVDAIRCHHVPGKGIHDPNLVRIIYVSNIIVNNSIVDPFNPIDQSQMDTGSIDAMGSQLDTLSDWFPDVSEEIESACKFFIEELRN